MKEQKNKTQHEKSEKAIRIAGEMKVVSQFWPAVSARIPVWLAVMRGEKFRQWEAGYFQYTQYKHQIVRKASSHCLKIHLLAGAFPK
jgi:hypothetical protein